MSFELLYVVFRFLIRPLIQWQDRCKQTLCLLIKLIQIILRFPFNFMVFLILFNTASKQFFRVFLIICKNI